MAKIKVHELAKELKLQSKEILSFLKGKGIEAKAAQSSVDEDAARLVREALGSTAQGTATAETSERKEEAKPVKEAPKEKEEAKPVKEAPKEKEEAKPAKEAPKEKEEAKPAKEAAKEKEEAKPTKEAAKEKEEAKPAKEAAKEKEEAKPAKEAAKKKEEVRSVKESVKNKEEIKSAKEKDEIKSVKETAKEKEEVKSVKEEVKKPAKETSKTAKQGDAPKKKKIIIINNPQNSDMSSQRSGQNGNNRTQGGQNNKSRHQGGQNQNQNQNQNNRGSGRKTQAAAPVRPIKPLTPPSPTPAVQMVPSKPMPKPRPEQAEKRQAEKRNAENKPMENQQSINRQADERIEVVSVNETEQRPPVQRQQNDKQQENRGDRGQNAGYAQDRPVKDGRSQNGRGAEERSQENRGQDNRDNQGGRDNRDNRDSRNNRDSRDGRDNQSNRDGRDNRDNRNNRDGRDNRDNRNNRDGRDNRENQNNRDSRDNRGHGSYGGSGSRQDRGQSQTRGGSGQNARYQGDRQNGYQRSGRPGSENGQNDRRGPGAGQGGGRNFNGSSRDGRGNGGQGTGFRDNKQSKGFGGEAPSKDIEKKREEDKRRANSQEKDKRSRKDHIYEEDETLRNKPGRFIKPEKKKEEVVEEVIKVITLPEMITIKDLADKMKQQPAAIVKKLFLEGRIVTVNQEISYEDAENIAMEYEILCEREVKVDVIEELLKEEEEEEAALTARPPVICVMGHVDHGKTSLLDAIRKTNVTDREAGGITQHIGAYTVTVSGRKITFLDTPGHEAFTAMRMRGANSTDIAILVVAADDGVMPQTVEAISHAKAAGIEIVVAVNKIDKPSANIERVKQELTEYELVATDWGGNTEFVPVSAKSGEGIEDLLETILLTADILELKANPNRRARGLVIEAELDKGRGPVATVLVQKGTLHVGDFVSAGACHGKVRAMIDDKGRRVKEATPSMPVEILGLSDVPSAGEVFLAHDNDKTARSYAETYLAQNKEKMLEDTKSKMSLDDLFSQIQEGNLKELNLIVKADVQGSVEAVKQSLLKLSNEEVVVKCIHGGVGAINESDVTLASASNAIIIGFNVRPDVTAKATAEREGVDVRLYKVIYQAIEDIEAAMKGMLDPVFEEKVIGHAEVRQIFKASQIGNIAGSYVMDGIMQRGCKIRIQREGTQIYEGALASLKRFKDDVKEVKEGFECGLVFEGFDQIQELDMVEAYIMVEVPR